MPTILRVLGTAETARRLGVTPRTVRRYVKEGRLEAVKTGPGTAGYVIAEDEVSRFVSEGAKA